MDQGIIKNLKTRYRAELVKLMLSLIDDDNLSSSSSAIDFSRKISACDDDVISAEEHNDLELTEAIVTKQRQTDEASEAEEDLDDFDELPPPLVKHKEARNAINMLQSYVLQQGMKERTWEHVDFLATAVEANAASSVIQTSLDAFFQPRP
ncbi:unnamed protein product [Clavelina lepadiformis]|uniref:Uncharacterized protein n=1 Tax=Clavelina lepadiformis TaxID=159417 RepID=A0ABP0GLB0_CLALP